MPFLDKEGLAHFWNQIIARLSKYETTENAQLKLEEAKSYTDNSIPTKVTDLKNDAEYITADALSGLGGSDMLKATYDKDDDGVVDDSEKLGGVAASEYAKKTDVPTVPTKVSAFENDKGYLTEHQSLADLATETHVSTQIGAHNTSDSAHNDIRLLVEGLTSRLNALADTDDTTLDQMSEIVEYIKDNRELIEGVTTNKVNVSDIINNLTTNVTNKPLSAAQGVVLKGLIDAIKVPTKLSELAEDSTHKLVTDAEKSTWNNKSNFSGNYNDLTNKPTIPTIPTKVSAFENDKGYLTSYTETDPVFKASAAASITTSDITKWNNKSNFDGNYNSLTNKPTKVSQFENDAEYITADALSGLGGGDMLKATYDKDDNGVVDKATAMDVYAAGNYAGKTIADLRTALHNWLSLSTTRAGSRFMFVANSDWLGNWNSNDTTSALANGTTWVVQRMDGYNIADYALLQISEYRSEYGLYCLSRAGGTWGNVFTYATKSDLSGKADSGYGFGESANVAVSDINNLTKTGFYQFVTDAFDGSATNYYLIHQIHTDSYACQTAIKVINASVVYQRAKQGGVWGDWSRYITSGNIGSQSVNHATTADSATAAVTATSAIQDSQGRNIADALDSKSSLKHDYLVSAGDGSTHYYKLLTFVPTEPYIDSYYEFDVVARTNKYATIRVFLVTPNTKYITNAYVTYDGNMGNAISAYVYKDEANGVSRLEVWGTVGSWDTWFIFPKTYRYNSGLTLTWDCVEGSALPTDATSTITPTPHEAGYAISAGSANTAISATTATSATTAGHADKADEDGAGNPFQTYYMKRGTYERIEGISSARLNLNNYTTAGFYNVKTAHVDNCPSGIGIDAVLLVYQWDSSGYECQEITESAASTTARRWIRHKNGSTWTAWVEVITSENIASHIPEGGGTDIDYGSSLPTNGSEGDVFLLTDSAGQTFTETISFSVGGPTDTTFKLAHKIRSIVSTTESIQGNYVTYSVTSSGMLRVVGDVYDPMTVTITYVSNGDWVAPQISDTVDISVSSYGYSISEVVLKATDSGNCITVLIDYSLSPSGAGEETWTFTVSNGENKTFLAAYALGGNGLVDLTKLNGYNGITQFGTSLNNLNLYFVDTVPKFSGQKAALVIYYA